MALPFFPELAKLLPVEADVTHCLLQRVSTAYVQARYEDHFTLPDTEIKQLKEWAERLLPQIKPAFERWMASLTST